MPDLLRCKNSYRKIYSSLRAEYTRKRVAFENEDFKKLFGTMGGLVKGLGTKLRN
jgi:hypothetical protein